MSTSTRTVKDPCRRKSDRHASVLSQKLLRTGPAHRQIANSRFINRYADILYQLSHKGTPNSSAGKESSCNVRDLGSIPEEDLLEKGMATHSSILAWEIP